jgi:phage FluMu protein Com
MALAPFCWPSEEPVICRGCTRCGAVLDETPSDELVCPRCGRMNVWTVTVNGQVVAAGRRNARGGISTWFGGELADLLPSREAAGSHTGWKEED